MSKLNDFQRDLAAKMAEIELRFDEPMAKHTSFRIGGGAEVMAFPKNVKELALILNESRLLIQGFGFIQSFFLKPKALLLLMISTFWAGKVGVGECRYPPVYCTGN